MHGKFDGRYFAWYYSCLMEFYWYLSEVLDVQGVGNSVFFLFTLLSMRPLLWMIWCPEIFVYQLQWIILFLGCSYVTHCLIYQVFFFFWQGLSNIIYKLLVLLVLFLYFFFCVLFLSKEIIHNSSKCYTCSSFKKVKNLQSDRLKSVFFLIWDH